MLDKQASPKRQFPNTVGSELSMGTKDGYDKLKPFGFAIHGAIDGYVDY